MQKIITCLWFDMECEEAINSYIDIFNNAPGSKKDSKIITLQKYPEGRQEEHMKGMEGKIITGIFELAGQRFMALDGGPTFKFSESVSLYVGCEDQEEVDYFWNRFIENGGQESMCGWLKDKYGMSWQIIPKQLEDLLSDPDPKKSERVMTAMLQMKKIEVEKLKEAYDGE